ncbi:membrane protein [Pilimelia anulata]|uniref:Membrane protein n=1 Tax=Pilimelia anulata TaxID=53371 RepID=A0A8J3B4C5_9ACTN|nr:CbtA family protein [Pilimelia anulata]GGJ79514.1 membrane protein [Pilimelia anulata]
MNGFLRILLRGLLAGLIGGLLAGTFAYAVGEPAVDRAIAIEEAKAAAEPAPADGHTHDEEALVSRAGQKGGLFLATALFGVAMGGLLATAYTLLRRRLRLAADGRAALALAGAAFLGLVLVPAVKYPANPPAVGDPETITQRTIAWLLLVVLGLLAVWAGVAAYRAVRGTEALRAAAAVGAFVATVAAAYAVLPRVDEVPADFPATLIWSFRLTAVGTQLVLWTGLGLAFAALAERAARRSPAAAPAPAPAAV